ncbi:Hypothetical protein FKW44_010749 [Caligus rogercresseyi]|uniref:Uncharacterized protein n=1 Tax=Caligus rogercresseyi TaxID=217165 RepID=A0A7T8HH05_CALRO|nr:Hypothetical protein FKW44_010749 [Caligus rogercresseyi]
MTLNSHLWLENLHLQNRRGKTTPAEMFCFCAAPFRVASVTWSRFLSLRKKFD